MKLKCDKKTIEAGDSVLVSWESNAADSVLLPDLNEKMQLNGNRIFYPEISSKIRVAAYKKGKRSLKTISVTVLEPDLNVTIPTSVSDEESLKVKWLAQNSSYVLIDTFQLKFPVEGDTAFKIDTSKTITVKVVNKFGKFKLAEFPVKIWYVEDLKYQKKVLKGNEITLAWKYKNAKTVYFSGTDQEYKTTDTLKFIPEFGKKYFIKIQRNNGYGETIQLDINVIIPKILYFTGTKTIFKGEEAILRWSAEGVSYVSILNEKDSLPVYGQIRVKPDKTTRYVMQVKGSGEVQEESFVVNVIQRNYVKNKIDYDKLKKGIRVDFEIFASDLTNYPEEVKLYVLAVDTLGNFICNLAPPFGSEQTSRKFFKELIESTAGKNNMKVKSFSVAEIHENIENRNDINITLDYSGSMGGIIRHLEKAVTQFIKKKNSLDRVSIVRFDDSLSTEIGLTSGKDSIFNRVKFDGLQEFGGYTALYAAIDEGLITLDNSKNNRQMLLFTDGYENSSFIYLGKRAIFAQQAAKKAKKQNTKINVVTYGSDVNEPLLKFLAVISGGNYYNLRGATDIQNVINEISYINRNYYVVTYKPYDANGSRTVSLVYDDNTGNNQTIKKEVFVGDDFDLTPYESSEENNYWTPNGKWGGLKPVSLPQAGAYFDFDKDNVKNEYLKKLNVFVEYLKANSQAKVVLFGHTDLVGTDEECDDLSNRRAQNVKKYFIDNGIQNDRIFIEICGKRNPVWSVEDEKWKSKENRRVEILIIQ